MGEKSPIVFSIKITTMTMTKIEQDTHNSIQRMAREICSKEIDWEQRRYEIAKAVLASAITSENRQIRIAMHQDKIIDYTIELTDKLIDRLSRKPQEKAVMGF